MVVVEPEDLVSKMGRHAPTLAFCGEAVMWAEFRSYEPPEVVRVDGRAQNVPGLELKGLQGVTDRITWYALAPPFV